MADGTLVGRHDPQGRVLRRRRARRRAAAPTSSTDGSPTCCCSRSSPTPASAPWSRSARRLRRRRPAVASRGAAGMSAHAFATAGLDALPVHAGLRAAAGDVRARAGHRAVGRPGHALPRLPLRAGGDLARPRPPGGGRGASPSRPRRCCTSPTSSPTRWPTRGGDRHRRAARRRRAGVLLQLRRRGQRGRLQAGPEVRRPRPSRGRAARSAASTAGRSPRSPPPASRPSTSRSSPMPEGFRHVPYGDLDALAAAIDPSVAAVLHRAGAGRGRGDPGAARVPRRASARCATSAGC